MVIGGMPCKNVFGLEQISVDDMHTNTYPSPLRLRGAIKKSMGLIKKRFHQFRILCFWIDDVDTLDAVPLSNAGNSQSKQMAGKILHWHCAGACGSGSWFRFARLAIQNRSGPWPWGSPSLEMAED